MKRNPDINRIKKNDYGMTMDASQPGYNTSLLFRVGEHIKELP